MNQSSIQSKPTSDSQMQDQQQTILDLKQLLADLDVNITHSKARLQETCSQMEKTTLQKLKTNSYRVPYLLLLAKIYTVKLEQPWKSEKLCNIILKDESLTIQTHLEAILKLSYVLFFQKKYDKATQKIESAYAIVKKRPELQLVISSFFDKIIETSYDNRLFKGLIASDNQKYQKAIDFYSQEFIFLGDTQLRHMQNKYFAAKSILQLQKTLPHLQFTGISQEQCIKYAQKIETQNAFQADTNISVYDRYLLKKKFLIKIIQLNSNSKKNIQRKNSQKYYSIYLQLARLKIKKALKNKTIDDQQSVRILQFILEEVSNGSLKNIYMILEYVSQEYQILKAIQNLILKKQKQQTLRSFKLIFSFSKYKKLQENDSKFLSKSNHQISEIKDEIDELFTGSMLIKINQKSGHQSRYFYFLKEEYKKNIYRMYYCNNEKSKKHNDKYYDYGGAKITYGKKSAALQRHQFLKFPDSQCFILGTHQKQINFFAPNALDFRNWKLFFENYMQSLPIKNEKKKIKIKEYMDYEQSSSHKKIFGFF